MHKVSILTLALAGAVAACGGGERRNTASADSLQRDLQLAPRDTTAPLADRPADTAAAPAAPAAPERGTAARPRPAPTRRTQPSRTAPAETARTSTAAATPAGASLAAGTHITAMLKDTISSRHNKVGDVIEATTTSDVKNSSGRVVIPKGSVVTLKITAIHESENKSDKTGTLTLAPSEVRINGRAYPLNASIDSVATQLQGRKTGAGDIAKVGAGAGVGAVVGRVIGGGATGAVIGGVLGGAVGAQRAVETKDRDVVVPAGSGVKMTLKEELTV